MQSHGHEVLSWVRLRGINAQCFIPSPLASWYQFTRLGEQGHLNVSSKSSNPQLLVRKSVAYESRFHDMNLIKYREGN